MDLKQLTDQLFSNDTLENLANQFGVSTDTVALAAQQAVPTLLKQLTENAQDEEKALALEKALDDHSHDEFTDVLTNLVGADKLDGSKILGHIFGGQEDQVIHGLGNTSGLGAGNMGSLLMMLAPLLLSFLGKQKKAKQPVPQPQSESSGGILGDLLGKIGGSKPSSTQKSDSSIGDLLGGLTKQDKPKSSGGGIGDLLGEITKDYAKQEKTDSSVLEDVLGGDLLGGILGGLFNKK